MQLIVKHFWILFIFFTILNAYLLKRRSNKYIQENPDLETGYNTYIKNTLIFGITPFLIVGVGILSNSVNNMFDLFQPRLLNPFVVAFHFCVVTYWILGIRWIYFKNGAEFFEVHPGLIQKSGFGRSKDIIAKEVKIFFPLMLLGGVIAEVIMWFSKIPIPKL
jgi:hypothetical protein